MFRVVVLPVALLLAAPHPAVAGSAHDGPEFQANTYTTGLQYGARGKAVARSPDGSFVVVWTDDGYGVDGRDGSGAGVFGQRFDALGSALGTEFQANTYTTFSQYDPAVGAADDGSFVIVWQSGDFLESQDGDGAGVFGQRYDASGDPVGTEFLVATYTTRSQFSPSVAVRPNGAFVVAWTEDGYIQDSRDKSESAIFAQRFDENGDLVGSDFRVNTYTRYVQQAPAVAISETGLVIIAWESFGQDDDPGFGVRAQFYGASGNPIGEEFRVNTYTGGTQRQPAVGMADDARFIIAWGDNYPVAGKDTDSFGIRARRYSKLGIPQPSEFQVNSYTTSSQQQAAVAVDANGRFSIVWESLGQDGDGLGIFGKRYFANGTVLTPDFQVNTYTTGPQFASPAVASDGSDDLVIVWASGEQDGSQLGMFGQLICNDLDSDTVCDADDICSNNDDLVDTDMDTVPDGCDACPGFDDQLDADGDTVPDACDICPGFDDRVDDDNDDIPGTTVGGVADPAGCDACPQDAANDADGDDICAGQGFLAPKTGDQDNCPVDSNTDQTDTDGDGFGNVCDICEGFDDDIDDDNDDIPGTTVGGVADPASCDTCPRDRFNDADGDGVCLGQGFVAPKIGDEDNCPAIANPSQDDTDGDGPGDACDICEGFDDSIDDDSDGIPGSTSGGIADPASCDTCPNDDRNDFDADGFCEGVGFLSPLVGDEDNCPDDANSGQEDGDVDLVGDTCDVCTNVGGARAFAPELKFDIKRIGLVTIDMEQINVATDFKLQGGTTLPPAAGFSSINPVVKPVQIVIEGTPGDVRLDETLTTDAFGLNNTKRGWQLRGGGSKWIYKDKTTDTANGIISVIVRSTASTEAPVSIKIRGREGFYLIDNPEDAETPLRLSIDLGEGSPLGGCAETALAPGDCEFSSSGNKLRCKQ